MIASPETDENKYMKHPEFPDREEPFWVWVETYEKNEDIHAEGVETTREAEGDYNGMEATSNSAVVKANSNLLEISQWDYKLTNATVPKVVRDAYVSSMESEGKELRDAKTAVETALSLGHSLKESTEKLDAANENYRKASGQVKKACVAPKAKAKAKASA
eukprot:s2106_g7.t1